MFRRTLRKNPFSGFLSVALLKNQKNEEKLVTPKARQNHVSGEQKLLKPSIQNYACRVHFMT